MPKVTQVERSRALSEYTVFFPLYFIPLSLGYWAALCFGLEWPASPARPASLRLSLCGPSAGSPQPMLLGPFRAAPQPQGPSHEIPLIRLC